MTDAAAPGLQAPESEPSTLRPCVDLHAHTTASDGTATPEQFVAAALASGVSAIAVTDHDTIAGVAAVRQLAEPHALRVIAGVELSVHDRAGREIHLLGLHLANLPLMDTALDTVRRARHDRALRIVQRLDAVGVSVTLDAVLDEAAGGSVGRPHVARALIKAGRAATVQEAFDRWLGAGRPAYVDKERLSLEDGIALVHRAGGLAIVAHPGPDGTRERIESFVAAGLDGIEVRHPSHSANEMKRLRGVARALELVPSGGSDWHGASTGPRTIGCMRVPEEWLDRQMERLAART